MTEDLEIVQQSQLQRDEAFYNMSYREAFQSAMERTDPEAKKLGFQLGYTLLSSNAKLEGFNWTARVLELDDKSLESQSSSNMETIGEVLERIHLGTEMAEEPNEIKKVLSDVYTSLKVTTPHETVCSDSISNTRKKTSLKECMDRLETGACKLSPF